MPKMKTHSGAKKRFRLTGSGKVRRAHAGKSHMMIGKSRSRLRKLRNTALVHPSDQENIKRILAVGGS